MSMTIGCEELASMFGLKNERAFLRRLSDLNEKHGFPRALPGSRRMFPRAAVDLWMLNWQATGPHVVGAPRAIEDLRARFKADRKMKAA